MICSNCQREIANYSNYCYFCGSRQQRAANSAVAPRRLQRSLVDCKVGGVCGGIAEYLDVDSTIVRLVWVVGTVCTAIVFGCVAYLAAWLIMPEGPMPMPVQPITPPAPASNAPQA